MKLPVAICQFPVIGDIDRNADFIERQMRSAARRGAAVVAFPESALSGAAGIQFPSYDRYDWDLLKQRKERIMDLARSLRLWVVLGALHPLSKTKKPHNAAYVINDRGQIVNRYDKRFCVGTRDGGGEELTWHTSGDHFAVFDIRGVRCGIAICHDFRYPELYRQYKKRGVQLMFHIYENAHTKSSMLKRLSEYRNVVPATMQTYAAVNHVWVCMVNDSAPQMAHCSAIFRPDGVPAAKLPLNRPGVLVHTLDTAAKYPDASEHWRDRAIAGVLHSGKLVNDPRSRDRKSL